MSVSRNPEIMHCGIHTLIRWFDFTITVIVRVDHGNQNNYLRSKTIIHWFLFCIVIVVKVMQMQSKIISTQILMINNFIH